MFQKLHSTILILTFLRSILKLSYANSADLNQTPRFAASDLGLHYLLMSSLCDAIIVINGLTTKAKNTQ